MALTPVTPRQGISVYIVTGLQAVRIANGGINGGILTNPASAAESLFVDPVGGCAPIGGVLLDGGTIYEIIPGGKWDLIPGQTTPTMVNATTSGHKFSITIW